MPQMFYKTQAGQVVPLGIAGPPGPGGPRGMAGPPGPPGSVWVTGTQPPADTPPDTDSWLWVDTDDDPANHTVASSVFDFGAVGDGVTDDTVAIQTALDSLPAGGTLIVPQGHTFAHSDVLTLWASRVTVKGGGTLFATNEERSAFLIRGSDVTVENLTFKMGVTTKRWTEYPQMKLRVRAVNTTIRNVVVDGSACAGIHIDGSSYFLIENVVVKDTRADAIHITYGSHHGRVIQSRSLRAGDDGVAIVSYEGDGGSICHDIEVIGARQVGQLWGRGFTVVGGQNITFRDIESHFSAGAAIYIACEPSYSTLGVENVLIDGAILSNSNRQADTTPSWRPSPEKERIVHGAVVIFNGRSAEYAVRNVTIRNVTITDTTPDAYDQVGLKYGLQENIELRNFSIRGGSRYPWTTIDVPDTNIRRIGWWQDGFPLPDIEGW